MTPEEVDVRALTVPCPVCDAVVGAECRRIASTRWEPDAEGVMRARDRVDYRSGEGPITAPHLSRRLRAQP